MQKAGVNPAITSGFSRLTASNNTSTAPPAPPPATSAPTTTRSGFSGPSGLTSGKGIGGLNTSSGRAAFGSLVGGKAIVSEKEKQAARAPVTGIASHAPAPVPTSIAPPPVRRTGPPAPPPPRTAQSTVVALYDYDGTDADDLPLQAGQTVVLLDKVSDDWWKGEFNGAQGIFPSSYVQEQ